MSGPLVVIAVLILAYFVFGMLRTFTGRLRWSFSAPHMPQWAKNIFNGSESAVWTILGLWGLAMGAFYSYWPVQFKEFWAWQDHTVFLGLPVILVVLAQALDRPTKTLATKWIGGMLVIALIVLYAMKTSEYVGIPFVGDDTDGTGYAAQKTVEVPAGGVKIVEVYPGQTINWRCAVHGHVFDARVGGPPVPCGPGVYTDNFTLTFDPVTQIAQVGFQAPGDKEMLVFIE